MLQSEYDFMRSPSNYNEGELVTLPLSLPWTGRHQPGLRLDLSGREKEAWVRLRRHPLIVRFSPGTCPGLTSLSRRRTSTSSSHYWDAAAESLIIQLLIIVYDTNIGIKSQ